MNSTIADDCFSTWNYDDKSHISYILWHIGGLLFTIFGIPGHLIHILITLNKKTLQQPTSLYFIAIATSEIIFLSVLFWLWCARMSLITVDPREIFSCGTFYVILIGPTITSNLYLALFSIDRTSMIIDPTRFRLLVTRRHVIIRILLTIVVVLLFLIPYHFFFYYDRKTTVFICEFYKHVDQWKVYIWTSAHAILFILLPSIITCVSAFILLYNRCTNGRLNKNNRSSNSKRMERNSLLLLLASIAIFICLLPTIILQIFIAHQRFLNLNDLCSKRWKAYRNLLYCFLTLSVITYSFKFYFRVAVSRSCRRDLIQLFKFISRQEQTNADQNSIPLNNKNSAKNTEIES